MCLRGLLGAKDTVTPLDHVEIDLEDAGFRPAELQKLGDVGLDPLAQEPAAWPEQDVLCGLLRDRAGAAELAAGAESLERRADLLEIEAVVEAEAGVLRAHHRAYERGRDLRQRDPALPDRRARSRADEHQRRRRRRQQPIDRD